MRLSEMMDRDLKTYNRAHPRRQRYPVTRTGSGLRYIFYKTR